MKVNQVPPPPLLIGNIRFAQACIERVTYRAIQGAQVQAKFIAYGCAAPIRNKLYLSNLHTAI